MKKILVLLLAFALVIGATVAGTLAYLTSYSTVTNTFTVGMVAITLDELDIDEDDNTADNVTYPNEDGEGYVTRDQANEYKLQPGVPQTKDPTVHVLKGSEPCYVRMLVTIENWSTLAGKFTGEDKKPESFVDGTWDPSIWPCEKYTFSGENNKNAELEFRYHEKVTLDSKDTDKDLAPLFERILLPSGVDLTDLDKVKITITAEAIQADGFKDEDGKSAMENAFAALDSQKASTTAP